MAIPVSFTSASMPDQNYFCGPFKSSGGAYYAVVLESTGSTPEVFKATDPTSSFTAQDTSNNPTQTPLSMWAYQDGDIIHIVAAGSSAPEIRYHRFSMTSDTWVTTGQTIEDLGKNAPGSTILAVSACTRGAFGDPVVCLYSGQTDRVMGTDYERVDHATRTTSSTWTLRGLALGTSSDEFWWRGCACAIGTSNSVHFLTKRDTTFGAVNVSRTLRSDNTLSTRAESSLITTESRFTCLISYDDDGVREMTSIYSTGKRIRFTESSGDATAPAGELITIPDATSKVVNTTPVVCLAIDGSTMHGVFALDSDSDLYYDKSTTPPWSTWGTDVEHRDAVTINRISCNVYNRSGARKLAMVYDDGGTIKYDEIDIDVVPTNLSDVKFPQQSSYIGPYEI